MAGMISSFTGQYAFLSNFAPAEISFEGLTYPTVEHAFQAAKSLNQADRERIAATVRPSQAKRLGRKVILREDWEDVKVDIMLDLVRAKFAAEPLYAQGLLDTETAYLMEGNVWHDNFWGSCDCGRCERPGANNLGVILMQVRDDLRGT